MNGNSYSVVRAIRGPIVLITLGLLFVLQNFTRFGFDQTWPVLLIVFGLMSLLQRGAGPPPPKERPPIVPPMPPPTSYASTGYGQSPYAQSPSGGKSGPASSSDPSQGGAA
jgi:Domain of unknown function (DUF5668)